MTRDCFGNDVTAADPATLGGIDDFVGGLLDYTNRALNILPAADAAPHVALAQTYAGMLHMLAETPGAQAQAAPYLRRAEAADASPRERALAAALAAWVADDIDATIAILTAIVAGHPRDLAALKLLHYHLFNRGAFPEMLRAALPAAARWPDLPYLSGMLAFAYEQLHLLAEAEAAARHALAIVPDDPWARHALAHVMLTEGRIDEGADFLAAATADGPGDLNSFMITHLWWHLALFRLSQGRDGDALAAYDTQVWAIAKDAAQDQIGAVSLLARLEIAGIDVGARWDELAGHLVARAADVVQPFLSVQYLYGLARAGRPEADRLLAAIEQAGQRDAIWREIALPLARGIVAAARGRHDEAAQRLTEILPRLGRLGGSHAQRDLFEQLLLHAAIRSGRLTEAQQMLEARRAHDPDGAALNRLLADVYRRLGLPDQAAVAAQRVRRRLAA